jgi:hypothetical protein
MDRELLANGKEFLESAEDNLLKARFNAAVSDFFKAITNFSDYLIYKETKIIIKNHNERFDILKKYYPELYSKIFGLCKKYRDSYNLRLNKSDALLLKENAYEVRRLIENKK